MPQIDAVVVKDNAKGVVSSALIEILLSLSQPKLRQAPWFIQTKKWNPSWLIFLAKQGITPRLIVFTDPALHRHPDVPTWITSTGYASSEAIAEFTNFVIPDPSIDNKTKLTTQPRGMLVFLPEGLSAIVFEAIDEQKMVFVQPLPNPDRLDSRFGVGKASIVFATMSFGLLHDGCVNPPVQTGQLLDGALRVAQYWMRLEYDRLRDPETLNAVPKRIALSLAHEASSKLGPIITLVDSSEKLKRVTEVKKGYSLTDEQSLWESSRSSIGLIRYDSIPHIELGRGCIELTDYICLAPTKRRLLARLISTIKSFDPRHASRSVAALLLAKPGSGKTQLAKSLEKSLGLHVLDYNITAMTRREDLLLCFDEIATTQVAHHNEKTLIFVDEINSEIENHSVYDSFLTPLEDGYYVRAGNKFHIKPCLWLFVGTKSLIEMKKSSKGSDFISRMSLDPLNLGDIPKEETPLTRIENIYVGIMIARSFHSGLNRIDPTVVLFLSCLSTDPDKVSVRLIRGIINRELYMDGHGCGHWRDGDRLWFKYAEQVDLSVRAEYEHQLAGMKQISVSYKRPKVEC